MKWIALFIGIELVIVLCCYIPFWIVDLRDSIWSLGKRRMWW